MTSTSGKCQLSSPSEDETHEVDGAEYFAYDQYTARSGPRRATFGEASADGARMFYGRYAVVKTTYSTSTTTVASSPAPITVQLTVEEVDAVKDAISAIEHSAPNMRGRESVTAGEYATSALCARNVVILRRLLRKAGIPCAGW
jgi:hypothetical protein